MNRLGLILMLLAMVLTAANAQNVVLTDATRLLDGFPESASTAAWGDMDNDGDLDLYIGGCGERSGALYMNLDGQFTDVSGLYGIGAGNSTNVLRAEWIDFNRDGYLDLSLVVGTAEGVRVLEQTPNHSFETVLITMALPYEVPIRASAWTDADGDGCLDLVVSNGATASAPMTVFAQTDLEFAEMRDNPFGDNIVGIGAITLLDYDWDGDMDVFFGSAGGDLRPHLFVNLGGGNYVDWGTRFELGDKLASEGAVWLDYNNDGLFDLYAPGDGIHAQMLRGSIVGHDVGLVPVTMPGEMTAADGGRHAQAVDVNMDGYQDLFVIRDHQEFVLLINREGTAFENFTPRLGIPNRAERMTGTWADWDNDGDRDLLLLLGYDGVQLYRNDSPKHEWATLNLVSRDTHTPLSGCNVRVIFDRFKQYTSTSPITCAPAGGDPRVLLVNGADRKSKNADLVITWPNGVERRYSMADICMQGTTTLYEPLAPADPEVFDLVSGNGASLGMGISPNPFNPTTTVSFDLPEAANVTLEVYNLTGQVVATLAHGSYAAGTHQVGFDGSRLASGLYIARLSAGSKTALSRMLLAK